MLFFLGTQVLCSRIIIPLVLTKCADNPVNVKIKGRGILQENRTESTVGSMRQTVTQYNG